MIETNSATERGLNPYTSRTDKAMQLDFRKDERAIGLTGDILDRILKGRWEEGLGTGLEEGRRLAASRYGQIYDDAFARGLGIGASEANDSIVSSLQPVLTDTVTTLTEIAAKTGSIPLKELASNQAETLKRVMRVSSAEPRE